MDGSSGVRTDGAGKRKLGEWLADEENARYERVGMDASPGCRRSQSSETSEKEYETESPCRWDHEGSSIQNEAPWTP